MRARQFLRPMSRLEIRCRMYLMYGGLPLLMTVVFTAGGPFEHPGLPVTWFLAALSVSLLLSYVLATRLPRVSWRALPATRAREMLELVKKEEDIRKFVASINSMRRPLIEADLELAQAFIHRIELQRERLLGHRAHHALAMIR